MTKILDIDPPLLSELQTWRRHIHANPELGYQEFETTKFIRSLLDAWGVEYETPLPTGTVAHFRGDTAGPTLVVRADIDALPIQEENQVEYVSKTPGVMHACGHDGHTAVLLGLAKALSARSPGMRGDVRLIFQPAEELVDGGAAKLIQLGALNGAAAVVGIHFTTALRSGTIGLTAGPLMSSDDRFDISIIGAGGHASSPHETVDALTIAAGLVSQLQTLISRRADPLSPAVVTVGSLHAGDVYNAIAGEAHLSGTVRTLSRRTRDLIESELIHLVDSYAVAHRAKAETRYHRGSPPLVNNVSAVEFVRPAAEASVGVASVLMMAPFLGAEDFAYYCEMLPAAFTFVGAGNEGSFPLHHPRFDLAEGALSVGLQFFGQIVERWCDPATAVPRFNESEELNQV